jgi:hypothetical protein
MDIRAKQWHSQLQITGVATPINRTGSLLSILSESIKDLQESTGRAASSGSREIILRLNVTPYGQEKHTDAQDDKIREVLSGIDDSHMIRNPNDGESYEEYYQFLRDKGMDHLNAGFIAGDWFEKPPMEDLENWMTDERAIRFRLLNGNKEVFDSAHPMEYEQLKHYIIHEYPQFAANITFRTA